MFNFNQASDVFIQQLENEKKSLFEKLAALEQENSGLREDVLAVEREKSDLKTEKSGEKFITLFIHNIFEFGSDTVFLFLFAKLKYYVG